MRFWCCPWWIFTLLMKTAEWIGMRFRCCWRLIPTTLRVRCWTVTVGLWIITMIWVFFCKALISYPHSVHIYIYIYIYMPVVAIVAVTGEEGSAPRRPRNLTYAASGLFRFGILFLRLCFPLFRLGICFCIFSLGNGNGEEWQTDEWWVLLTMIHHHKLSSLIIIKPHFSLHFCWISYPFSL